MRLSSQRFEKILPHYRDTPERRYFKITILLIIAVVVVMILAVVITFFLSIRGPEEIMVPNLVGTSEEEMELITAMKELQDKGLYAKIQLKHSSTKKRGTVIDQRPRAGSLSKAGRQVLLTISQGPVISSVGDYRGKTLDELKLELQEIFSGDLQPLIKIKEPVMYVHGEAPLDTIVAQNPEVGTSIRENEVIILELVVSKGPKADFQETASFLFKDFQIILEELSLADIPFTFQVRAAGEREAPGTIVQQVPAPNEELPLGQVIELIMTAPQDVEDGFRFELFEAELTRYPILVDIRLEEKGEDETRVILDARHPGGPIGIPCIIREDAELEFYVNGRVWRR